MPHDFISSLHRGARPLNVDFALTWSNAGKQGNEFPNAQTAGLAVKRLNQQTAGPVGMLVKIHNGRKESKGCLSYYA